MRLEPQVMIKVWDNAGTLYATAIALHPAWGIREEQVINAAAARTLGYMIRELQVNLGVRVELRPFLAGGPEVGWVATLTGRDVKNNYAEALDIIDRGHRDEPPTSETPEETERAEVPAPAIE